MTRVYFVRHAVHDLVGRVLAGRMPGVRLGETGRAQAEAVARMLGGVPVGAVLSSPIERCVETATTIATAVGLPVQCEEDLTEIDCGDWTGAAFDTLQADPRWTAWNRFRSVSAPPNGEATTTVQARIVALISRLAASDGAPTVPVTHSDIIKVAVLTLMGASLDGHDTLEVDPASVTTIDLWPGGGKVVRLNAAATP